MPDPPEQPPQLRIAGICSSSMTTVVNRRYSACALSCHRRCSAAKTLSSSHDTAALGNKTDRSYSRWNWWWKLPQTITTGIPAKSRGHPRNQWSCSLAAFSVCALRMLTLLVTSTYFSCQSILDRPSMKGSPRPASRTPSTSLPTPLARPTWPIARSQAEWSAVPLIRAAAIPEVTVTSSRLDGSL